MEEGEEVERGIVGRRQVLYIAVSVGRYRIDRKDTRFLSKAKQRERERDNEPERRCVCVCACV